ncbi:MAG: ribbon-helix-helix domain-containing protein [Actinomycetota bacterium]|nr:ribbon-helix-helix domain-containing protein [Actinomycetota bacterium]
MRDQLRRTAQNSDTTLTQLVLDAIEANIDQLAELIAREQPSKTGGAGKLFPQREHAAPRSQETRVATSLRIGSDNLRVLDDLVKKHHADNRSQLITAVLRDHLK